VQREALLDPGFAPRAIASLREPRPNIAEHICKPGPLSALTHKRDTRFSEGNSFVTVAAALGSQEEQIVRDRLAEDKIVGRRKLSRLGAMNLGSLIVALGPGQHACPP
jgi:hypothetical protein